MAALNFNIPSIHDDDDPWDIEQKLFAILDEYVQPGSTTTADNAAERLWSLRPDRRADSESVRPTRESVEDFKFNFYVLIMDIVAQIPSNHPSLDRLVQLAFALRTANGGTEGPYPTLPNVLGEWLEIDPFDPYADDAENLRLKMRSESLFSFACRLTAAGYEDFTGNGIWALSEALEETTREETGKNAGRSKTPVLDAWVPVAAEWILRKPVGAAMLKNCREDSKLSMRLFNVPGQAPELTGRRGFFWERWLFWQKRFGEVADMRELTTAARDVACKAEEKMAKLAKD